METKAKSSVLTRPLVVGLLAGFCCLLWGSAIPFINIGYRLFGISGGETATQIHFAGCRFFL
ncbi:MAG: EamA/RhaT family transporter, partial [Clostridiales bacterium]|nr:EamA/RhaT family transporter [Clostridiales bacterium]